MSALEGKTALVTGVSHAGQIGEAVARKLADSGAALVICARKQSDADARAQELRNAGVRVLGLAASLTDEAQVDQLVPLHRDYDFFIGLEMAPGLGKRGPSWRGLFRL